MSSAYGMDELKPDNGYLVPNYFAVLISPIRKTPATFLITSSYFFISSAVYTVSIFLIESASFNSNVPSISKSISCFNAT